MKIVDATGNRPGPAETAARLFEAPGVCLLAAGAAACLVGVILGNRGDCDTFSGDGDGAERRAATDPRIAWRADDRNFSDT